MRIATISLNINTDDLNYGAILHSWAFQKYIMRQGIECEVLDYVTPKFESKDLKYPYKYLLREGNIRSFIISVFRKKAFIRRFEKFERFKENNMIISEKKYNRESLNDADLSKYDAIVCESDVIWDPNFFDGTFDDTFFLALDSMKQLKRVAYSASMGNLEFDEKQEERFKWLISNLNYVSCRETYAAKYVNDNTNKSASNVLDPVLLLQEEDYDEILVDRLIDEPYALLYTPVGWDINIIREAKKIAKMNGLKLVEVSSFPWNSVDHRTIVDAGVGEFLSLIKHSSLVLTNSFHAVCFSMIFHKQFYAFSRATGKKIEDICKRMHLQSCFINKKFSEPYTIDYMQVEKLLKTERNKSENFIFDSIINSLKKEN